MQRYYNALNLPCDIILVKLFSQHTCHSQNNKYVNSVDIFSYLSPKIPDEWIGKVKSFLNSKPDR